MVKQNFSYKGVLMMTNISLFLGGEEGRSREGDIEV